MSASISGTTYTSLVSGITITSGGASNAMGGGREIPTLISTSAIVAVGTTVANPKKIVPTSNCFIVSPPCPPCPTLRYRISHDVETLKPLAYGDWPPRVARSHGIRSYRYPLGELGNEFSVDAEAFV